jgi:uncharacterized protein (DUF488 family)
MKSPPRLLSVGHSNHELAFFLALLDGAGVTAIADVRSSPFSRRLPHFSRPQLEPVLRERGIAYVFLGGQLGGRPADEGLYDDEGEAGRVVNYERVRATGPFGAGLERLERGAEKYAIAMLCGEEDPLDCHRGLMITPALKERGLAPLHVRKDGRLETTEEMEGRLLDQTIGRLFADLAEAYRVMGRRKAYRVVAESGEDIGA